MREMLRHIAKKMKAIGLIGLIGPMGLIGCSDDAESGEKLLVNIEAQTCSTAFEEEEPGSESRVQGSITRAWSLPDGYVTFASTFGTDGLFSAQKDLVNASIDAFFTSDAKGKQEGILYYKEVSSGDSWHLSNMEIEGGGTYQLYGYIPQEDADDADIEPYNGSYSNGAKLTIRGLNTVTASDVCVIIGAKDGSSKDDDTGVSDNIRVRSGNFDVNFHSGTSATNYIFLLFDHIYSSLRFSFKVDADYNDIRTIRLRKLELIAYASDAGGGVKAKYNATIYLRKNDIGVSPIASVTFSPVSTSANVAPTTLYDGTETNGGMDLSTTPSNFLGCFVPGINNYFKLRSTYDVYDKKGDLIREHCQAENTIDLRDKFVSYMHTMNTMRGHCYTYNITVQPTYLYMLSDPDMDNPTIKVK